MSYLVLARKYRPQTFLDLVGQEQVSRTLKNALISQRIAHAYLFAGPRGVGKTTAARLLAMALSCQEEDINLHPCGQCQNCLDIKNGQTVDVIEVDAASNRGINEIRDLRETVKYLPAKNKYKVYIIDEVHALTKDAFNALLKTLEEPPKHVVFIFATTETHKILATILSRCQRYDFKRIKISDMVQRLSKILDIENIKYEIKALELIARQAEGALRDALSLLDQVIAFDDSFISQENVQNSLGLINQTLVEEIIKQSLKGDNNLALSYLEDSYNLGYDFKDLGRKLLELIRGLSIYKASPSSKSLLNLTESEDLFYQEITNTYSLETLNNHFNYWIDFQNKLNRSSHPRWLMEAHVINLCHKINLMPISELSSQLNNFLNENFEDFINNENYYIEETQVKPEKKNNFLAEANINFNQTEENNNISDENLETENNIKIDTWADFIKYFKNEIENNSLNKHAILNSLAEEFSKNKLVLILPKNIEKSSILSESLENFLNNLFKKAFNKTAEITLKFNKNVKTDNKVNENFANEKITTAKQNPKIKALTNKIKGDFITYLVKEKIDIKEENEENISDDLEETNNSNYINKKNN